MYDVTSYSGAIQFASDVFRYLNGKVNYIIPANQLLFSNPVMGSSFGDATLDIVEINLHNILKDINSIQPNRIAGLILYTITHELLHIDQHMFIYSSLANHNLQQTEELIELSAHVMTSKVLEQIIDGSFFDDFDIEEVALPPPEMFMEIPAYDINTLSIYENSFYRVPSPIENAVFYLTKYLDVDFDELLQTNRPINIILTLNLNNKLLGTDYIYYLYHWLPIQIFNLLRPLVILQKGSLEPNTTVTNCIKYDQCNIDAPLLSLTIDVYTSAKLAITNINKE